MCGHRSDHADIAFLRLFLPVSLLFQSSQFSLLSRRSSLRKVLLRLEAEVLLQAAAASSKKRAKTTSGGSGRKSPRAKSEKNAGESGQGQGMVQFKSEKCEKINVTELLMQQ